ncbi:MAG: hypothetical protein N3E52_02375 [Candidatus Bathyarchaeota archaeon]|nr:hypothetical protein [Candidatus Bathyarchaeota archaeon]
MHDEYASCQNKVVPILLVTMINFSAFVLVYVPARYHPIYFIAAERLSQPLKAYFILENPDTVVSQAISHGNVTLYSLEDTQIDKLINAHNTGSIKVKNSYYSVKIAVADKFRHCLNLTCI